VDIGILRVIRYLTFHSNPRRYGAWAVVTGDTDGIGLGMAKRLAQKGMNIVIIGRDEAKVSAAIAELAKFKVETRPVVADLSRPDAFPVIEGALRELEVGVLVNNVGRSYDHAEFLTDVSPELIDSIIALNVIATTRLTRAVLPGMVARRKGAVVNVSSAAGSLPTGDPFYAVYSGTKAYVDAFSKSLHYELRKSGVFVQSQVPYFVATKLSKIRKPSLAAPSADTYAVAAVDKIGLWPLVVPYWVHAVQHAVAHSVPVALLAKFVLSHHFGIRKRALQKKQEQAAKAGGGTKAD